MSFRIRFRIWYWMHTLRLQHMEQNTCTYNFFNDNSKLACDTVLENTVTLFFPWVSQKATIWADADHLLYHK